MIDFVQFLLDVAEGRYLFNASSSKRLVCFVVKEQQFLISDFMRRVVAFESGKFRYSDLEEEASSTKYDSCDQQCLFGDVEQASADVTVCWLQDFPQNPESTFLSPTQRHAKINELSAISAKNTASLYFFSLSQREFDANPGVLEGLGALCVKIPEALDYELFSACAYFFELPATCDCRGLYNLRPNLSLDDSLIFIEHGACVSRKGWDFFAEYSENLLASTVQMRDLSEFFWTKDATKFFSAWSKIAQEYPEQFWISYWSNQFFLAYFFIERASSGVKVTPVGQEHALSPNFTWKQGWKRYTKQQCAALHNRLYEVDCELKNGSDEMALQFFFSTHFLSK